MFAFRNLLNLQFTIHFEVTHTMMYILKNTNCPIVCSNKPANPVVISGPLSVISPLDSIEDFLDLTERFDVLPYIDL